MRGFWFKYIVICLVILSFFTLLGCSTEKKNNNSEVNKEDSIKPKEFVRNYYNSEVSKDKAYLSKFYSNPDMLNTEQIKTKLTDFGIIKVELIDLYNIQSKDRLKIMVSAFNVYFKSIKKPRPDIEIITLIYKNNSWHFLNDESIVTDKEYEWLQNEKKNQRKFIVQNKKVQDILKSNTEFDSENEEYMKTCQEKFQKDLGQ